MPSGRAHQEGSWAPEINGHALTQNCILHAEKQWKVTNAKGHIIQCDGWPYGSP